MKLVLLHTNDFHGQLTPEKAAQIHRLRQEADLYADCGDCIKTGNLGIPLRQEPVWELLQTAGCDVGTMGNRESHILDSAFRAKIRGHQHPLLVANMTDRSGQRAMPPLLILERKGVRIGVFGVMVAMVTPKMKTQSASAYLWSSPLDAAEEQVRELRPQVDLLIALTHIGFAQDRALAERCPEIDVILGGHSHTVLEQPTQVNNVWIAQTGSHGRFVGRYEWDTETRSLEGQLLPLSSTS